MITLNDQKIICLSSGRVKITLGTMIVKKKKFVLCFGLNCDITMPINIEKKNICGRYLRRDRAIKRVRVKITLHCCPKNEDIFY